MAVLEKAQVLILLKNLFRLIRASGGQPVPSLVWLGENNIPITRKPSHFFLLSSNMKIKFELQMSGHSRLSSNSPEVELFQCAGPGPALPSSCITLSRSAVRCRHSVHFTGYQS